MSEATIRLLPSGEAWRTLGTERLRGIAAENIEASANEWGPDQMSFLLKAQPGTSRPDVLPYTPVELEIDGLLCWAGRVKARPADESSMTVSCEGWQYHLDDDVFDRAYVHARLSDYSDQRTFLSARLANFHVAGTVATDGGSIVIGWPNGAVLGVGNAVGVTLDLGPDSTGKRLVMDWESTNNDGFVTCYVRTSDTEDALPSSGFDNFFTFTMASGASGTTAGTAATARRFVHVFLYIEAGGAGTLGGDLHLRIKAAKVFRDTTYESGNASILKADAVAKDALALAPQLNQDTRAITAGTFAIPAYLTGGYATARQAIEAVNAYENYLTKIGGADLKTLVFSPKPSAPLFEAGNWSGAEFADASVAGEQIFPKVVVDGTGPDSARLVSKRTQTGTLVDRRGYTRAMVLPISSAITQAVADRFGDLWLVEHKTAPFAGALTVTGEALRHVVGGGDVPPHVLLTQAGEKVMLSHRLDPDTGGWARDGRIAGVTYRHNERKAEIAIDDRRTSFETVLSRYGVLVDQLR